MAGLSTQTIFLFKIQKAALETYQISRTYPTEPTEPGPPALTTLAMSFRGWSARGCRDPAAGDGAGHPGHPMTSSILVYQKDPTLDVLVPLHQGNLNKIMSKSESPNSTPHRRLCEVSQHSGIHRLECTATFIDLVELRKISVVRATTSMHAKEFKMPFMTVLSSVFISQITCIYQNHQNAAGRSDFNFRCFWWVIHCSQKTQIIQHLLVV